MAPEPEKKQGLTTSEVSRMLGIPRGTVARFFEQGILTGWKNPITGRLAIDPGSLKVMKRRAAVMTKTRGDIVDDIHEKLEKYSKGEVADIVESVFDIMKETVQREGKIVISGFGVFATKNKRARRGRNPQTGSDLQISPRRILTFKPSQVLKAGVNRATGEIEAGQRTDEIG